MWRGHPYTIFIKVRFIKICMICELWHKKWRNKTQFDWVLNCFYKVWFCKNVDSSPERYHQNTIEAQEHARRITVRGNSESPREVTNCLRGSHGSRDSSLPVSPRHVGSHLQLLRLRANKSRVSRCLRVCRTCLTVVETRVTNVGRLQWVSSRAMTVTVKRV